MQVDEVARSRFEFRAVSLSAISILVLADRQPLVAEGPVIRKFTFSDSRCNGRMVCAQSDTSPTSLSRNVVRGALERFAAQVVHWHHAPMMNAYSKDLRKKIVQALRDGAQPRVKPLAPSP